MSDEPISRLRAIVERHEGRFSPPEAHDMKAAGLSPRGSARLRALIAHDDGEVGAPMWWALLELEVAAQFRQPACH
jgi:hypothetical protein